MWATLLLLSIITLVFIKFWKKDTPARRLAPGPICFPLIGSIPFLLPYIGRTQEFTRDMCKKYGPIFGFQFGLQYFVFTEDEELVKGVLNSEDFINRTNDHPMHYERSFGKQCGLITGGGDSWKEIRPFTIRALRQFGFGKGSMEDSIDYELQEMLQRLQDKIDNRKNGEAVQFMQKFFQIPSTNILWSMVAGFRFSYEDARLKRLLQLADSISKEFRLGYSPMYAYPFLRFIPGLTENQRLQYGHRKVHAVIQEIVDEKLKGESYHDNPSDVIEVFLNEIEERKRNGTYHLLNNHFTHEQLIMVGTDLFITGIDSTSTALEFAILYMILNPEVQAKIQEEIDEVVGKERLPNLVDKQRMPYTEASTLEILRLSSNLPLTIRTPSKEDLQVGGYSVPKGTLVGVNLQAIHYSEKIWGDPTNFRPERFLDSTRRNIVNQDKIMPFGYGKRMCLGEVLARSSFFKFFTSLLQKYSFLPSPDHPKPSTNHVFGFNRFPQPYYALIRVRK